MYQKLSGPLSVQIEITDNCNEMCHHCYRSCQLRLQQKTKVLKPEDAVRVVEEVAVAGAFAVALTGGEPLLYPKSVIAAVKTARARGLICNVNSNLQKISEEIVQVFAENGVRVLTSLISFDEACHDRIVGLPGAHNRLLGNIRKLVELGVKVSANMVVRHDNANHVYNTGLLAKSLGIHRFSATKAAPTPGIDYATYAPSPQQIKTSLDALLQLNADTGLAVDILESYPFCFLGDIEKYAMFARRNCTAGIFNCSIGPDGAVRPCSHASMTYGNVFSESLLNCWSRMDDWRGGKYINEECRHCRHLPKCTGGCRIDAKICGGDIRGRDPLMTNPSLVVRPSKRRRPVLSLPEKVAIPAYVRLRAEAFGGIAKIDENVVYLGMGGYHLLSTLPREAAFHWQNLATNHKISKKELRGFFQLLFEKKAVIAAE